MKSRCVLIVDLVCMTSYFENRFLVGYFKKSEKTIFNIDIFKHLKKIPLFSFF